MRKCYSLPLRCCFVSACLALSACATLPPTPAERSDTVVAAPFGQTWDAVVDYFARASIPIKTIDRASGIIAAETTRLAGDNQKYGVCRNALRSFTPQGASFNVLVRGDSTRSTIRVTTTWLMAAAPYNVECATTDVWEKSFEVAIRTKAEAH